MLTTTPYLEVRRPSPTTAEFTVTTCPQPTISNRLLLALVFLLRVLLAASVLFVFYLTWPLSTTLPPSTATAQHSELAACLPTGPSGQVLDYYNASEPYINNHDNSNLPTATLRAPSNNCASSSSSSVMTTPLTLAQLALDNTNNNDTKTTTIFTTNFSRPHNLFNIAWLPYLLALLAHTQPGLVLSRLATALPPSFLYPLCAAALYTTIVWRIHTTESLLVLRGLGIQTTSSSSATSSLGGSTRFIPTEKIRDVLINEAFRGFGVRYYLVVVVDGEEDVVVVFPRLLPRRKIVERVWRGVRGCLWEPQEGGGWDGGG